MSDIRLVNVVPIVNGWNDAAKKNLEEAKTLMASGNHLDYNKGVVKESVANLVSGFADDLMSAPFIDPETLRPMVHWNGQYDGYYYQPSGSYMLPPTCAINGCCLSKPPQSWCYVAEAKEDDAL